jgi:hypothetical protein
MASNVLPPGVAATMAQQYQPGQSIAATYAQGRQAMLAQAPQGQSAAASGSSANQAGTQYLARGGKVRKPTFLVGEGNPKYPEYVIPTDPKHRDRALQILKEAGEKIGVKGMDDGGSTGTGTSSLAGGGTGTSSLSGGNSYYGPSYNGGGQPYPGFQNQGLIVGGQGAGSYSGGSGSSPFLSGTGAAGPGTVGAAATSPLAAGGGALNFGNVPGNYQSAYANALSLNSQNYSNILSGYQGLLSGQQAAQGNIQGMYNSLWPQVQQTIAGIGASQQQQIADTYAQQSGNITQQMTNSGLGNTTAATSAQGVASLNQQKASVALANQIAQLNAGYQSQLGLASAGYANQANMQNTALGQSQLNFMNSVNAPYPSMQSWQNAAQQRGAAAGYRPPGQVGQQQPPPGYNQNPAYSPAAPVAPTSDSGTAPSSGSTTPASGYGAPFGSDTGSNDLYSNAGLIEAGGYAGGYEDDDD